MNKYSILLGFFIGVVVCFNIPVVHAGNKTLEERVKFLEDFRDKIERNTPGIFRGNVIVKKDHIQIDNSKRFFINDSCRVSNGWSLKFKFDARHAIYDIKLIFSHIGGGKHIAVHHEICFFKNKEKITLIKYFPEKTENCPAWTIKVIEEGVVEITKPKDPKQKNNLNMCNVLVMMTTNGNVKDIEKKAF